MSISIVYCRKISNNSLKFFYDDRFDFLSLRIQRDEKIDSGVPMAPLVIRYKSGCNSNYSTPLRIVFS